MLSSIEEALFPSTLIKHFNVNVNISDRISVPYH